MKTQKERLPIAFQGELGAYSDLAARRIFPDKETLHCLTFEEVFSAIEKGEASYAIIPIENSIAGRVADIHYLLPRAKAFIVGEHFQPIEHHLLGVPEGKLEDIEEVHSHTHALAQCRIFLNSHNLKGVVHADTAGAAKDVALWGKKNIAAIASPLAGKLYNLKTFAKHIEDKEKNVTRFIVIALKEVIPDVDKKPVITSILFRVRSVPAALYKAIGGFATNGINLIKLESYLLDNTFSVAQFYIEVEGHQNEEKMKNALEELSFFSKEVHILGTYKAHPYRKQIKISA